MLKKLGNLEKNLDFFFIDTIVNLFNKPKKVEDMINFLMDNKEIYDIVKPLYILNTFSFI